MPLDTPAPTKGPSVATLDLHQLILDRLGPSHLPKDHLTRDLRGATGRISSEIAALEIDGKNWRDAGGVLARFFGS